MVHEIDAQNMEAVIAQSPEQFSAGLAVAAHLEQLPAGSFTNILVAGMGGSWMAAALVADAGLSRVPIRIHRAYGLPKHLDASTTLVIVSSYSGNTEEVLSAFEAARDAGFGMVGMASGGKLQELCEGNDVPFLKISADPPTMQPRSATGYGVGIMVGLLDRLGLAVDGAKAAVSRLGMFLADSMDTARAAATTVLADLPQATPVVYASDSFATVARIWKIKFNENAKTPAFWNVLPELNHNEMTGWIHHHGPFHLIVLSDPDEDPRIQAREQITRTLLKEGAGVASSRIVMQGTSLLEKMFYTLLVGDWTSYAVALRLEQDPSPVDLVEDFKGLLKARPASESV